MIFIETPIFTDDLYELLSDDEYSDFQKYLAQNPTVEDIIQHTGRFNGRSKENFTKNE